MNTPVDIKSPDEQALAAMLGHHAELRGELDHRVAALRTTVQTGADHQGQLAALREFIDGSVLPHAIAEEATLYQAAAPHAPLLVRAMIAEHRALADRARALAGAQSSSVEALAAAEGFAAVFAVHVDKENDLLLPSLLEATGVSLSELLQAMHQHMEEAGPVAHQDDGDTPEELDVRTLPHGAGRHEAIFARLDALHSGDRLVIVNDHDPRPLRFQLDAAWPGLYAWEYLQAGPQVWRIAITRQA